MHLKYISLTVFISVGQCPEGDGDGVRRQSVQDYATRRPLRSVQWRAIAANRWRHRPSPFDYSILGVLLLVPPLGTRERIIDPSLSPSTEIPVVIRPRPSSSFFPSLGRWFVTPLSLKRVPPWFIPSPFSSLLIHFHYNTNPVVYVALCGSSPLSNPFPI